MVELPPIYTSEKEGSDENGDGSQDKPFKTLLQVRKWFEYRPCVCCSLTTVTFLLVYLCNRRTEVTVKNHSQPSMLIVKKKVR